ncbi:hypothetical protein BJ138DRAFT_1196197, partial [Hygrophoropsis aurantiaca]
MRSKAPKKLIEDTPFNKSDGNTSSARVGKQSKFDNPVLGAEVVSAKAVELEGRPVRARKPTQKLAANSSWVSTQHKRPQKAITRDLPQVQNGSVELHGDAKLEKRKRAESTAENAKGKSLDSHNTSISRHDHGGTYRESKKAKSSSMSSQTPFGQRYRAAKINVDAPDELVQNDGPPLGKPVSHRNSGTKPMFESDGEMFESDGEMFDEDGEENICNAEETELEEQGSDDDDQVEDRNSELSDVDLDGEGVCWTSSDAFSVDDESEKIMTSKPPKLRHNTHSRASSVKSYDSAPPPTTDSDFMDELDETPVPQSTKTKSTAKTRHSVQKKLEDEMPTISEGKTSRRISKQIQKASSDTSRVEHEIARPWLSRTNLELTFRGSTAEIAIKRQAPEMQDVIRGSFNLGMIAIAFGNQADLDISPTAAATMVTPMSATGMEKISHTALIQSAEAAGYDGENDIAHRLEEGSVSRFIKPVVDYTAHRLGLYQTAIKKAIVLVTPRILNLATNSPTHNATLVETNNFIYPWSPEKGFDRSKPYHSEVIKEAIRCAFFTQSQYTGIGLQCTDRFGSSSTVATQELEIPPAMVAMAATG